MKKIIALIAMSILLVSCGGTTVEEGTTTDITVEQPIIDDTTDYTDEEPTIIEETIIIEQPTIEEDTNSTGEMNIDQEPLNGLED